MFKTGTVFPESGPDIGGCKPDIDTQMTAAKLENLAARMDSNPNFDADQVLDIAVCILCLITFSLCSAMAGAFRISAGWSAWAQWRRRFSGLCEERASERCATCRTAQGHGFRDAPSLDKGTGRRGGRPQRQGAVSTHTTHTHTTRTHSHTHTHPNTQKRIQCIQGLQR